MPFSFGQTQIRLSNTTQRTPEEAAKKYAAPYWRAHETSLGKRPAKQDQKGHGRCPFLAPNPQRPLLFTRTATYYFIVSACQSCDTPARAPHPMPFSTAFLVHLLFALRLVYSNPPPLKTNQGTTPGTRRYGICKGKATQHRSACA